MVGSGFNLGLLESYTSMCRNWFFPSRSFGITDCISILADFSALRSTDSLIVVEPTEAHGFDSDVLTLLYHISRTTLLLLDGAVLEIP